MSKLLRNGVETLVNRALEPDPMPLSPAPELPPRPMLYKGTMPGPTGEMSPSMPIGLYRNRKVTTRKVSTFNLIVMLLGTAAAIVLYISNVIAVDTLMSEINALQTQHRKILSEQEILRAEVNRLSSLERINRRAAEDLGLVNPKEPPVLLSVDPEKVREVEEALKKK